ncbi:hypothetical protein EGR_08799 [Echinococcus granulosus]|uniref:Uncharacterized protein n=1 Tax=Echinococcus granulosus TaxID=6210 RepID=W6USA9_ECHGR|nr:hypothetical protein EGR_08799 [Echinococcus granulosus]EUB56324.1 hypothetical protein EGR_08799 [Echinococcus granulosus]
MKGSSYGHCCSKVVNATQVNCEAIMKRLLVHWFKWMRRQGKFDFGNRISNIKGGVRERSAFNGVKVKECEIRKMRQLLLLFAEMLHPELSSCLKSCVVGSRCGREEEKLEGLIRNAEEEEEGCEAQNLKHCLFHFAQKFCPDSDECLGKYVADLSNHSEVAESISPCENSLEMTGSCRAINESPTNSIACQRKYLIIFLLLLARRFYPKLAMRLESSALFNS